MWNLDFFWIFWALTAALCVWQLLAVFMHPTKALELPTLACLMWLYIYVYMAQACVRDLQLSYLSPWLALSQAMAFFSLLGLMIGWRIGVRNLHGAPDDEPDNGQFACHTVNYRGLVRFGIFSMIVGIIGTYTFRSQEVIDWQGSSAYWYMLYHLGYPGLAMALMGLARRSGRLRLQEWLLLLVLVTTAIYPYVLEARRGPLYPLVIVSLFSWPLFKGRAPRPTVLLGGVAVAGTLMLAFVLVRCLPGETWSEKWKQSADQITLAETLTWKAKQTGDNEYVYHCYMVAAAYETGKYQYGTNYLNLLVSWVPRSWWPDKPGLKLNDGWFESPLRQIHAVVRDEMTNGAAVGGVAEVFLQFGLLTPVFWGFIGWLTGKLCVSAWYGSRDWPQVAYVGILCGCHWLIAQGVVAAFVPTMIYVCWPWLGFQLNAQNVSCAGTPDTKIEIHPV